MGGFLDKPKTEKSQLCGNGNGVNYGVVSMQGWRVEMEDSHSAVIGLSEELKGMHVNIRILVVPGKPKTFLFNHSISLSDWSYFAVFDGHCGSIVSAHCANHLLPTIIETDDFKKITPKPENEEDNNEPIRQAIHDGFLKYRTQ